MRCEVRIMYRTHVHPRAFMHWQHDNLDDLPPGEVLRVYAELAHDPEVAVAWVERREVTEWRRAGGAELLHIPRGRDKDMTVAPFLKAGLYAVYLSLLKAGRLDVLASDPEGENHVVSVDGGVPRTVSLAELEQMITDMAADPPT